MSDQRISTAMRHALEYHAQKPNQWAKNEGTAQALVRRGLLAVTGGSMWNRYTITDAGMAAISKPQPKET